MRDLSQLQKQEQRKASFSSKTKFEVKGKVW